MIKQLLELTTVFILSIFGVREELVHTSGIVTVSTTKSFNIFNVTDIEFLGTHTHFKTDGKWYSVNSDNVKFFPFNCTKG